MISLSSEADRAKATAIEVEVNKIATERAAKETELVTAAFEQALLKFPENLRESLRQAHRTPRDSRTPAQTKLLEEYPSATVDAGNLYLYSPDGIKLLAEFDNRINLLRATKPVEEFLTSLVEWPNRQSQTHLFHRGDYRQPRQVIQPGDLSIAAANGVRFTVSNDDGTLPTTGRRLAYARHITNGRHPFVARALMNRVWLNHFGKGIVDTPGDFGNLGLRPTHPELLDLLALEFVDQAWSLKKMHKWIMTSTAYRQSSHIDTAKQQLDSANTLYWRMPLRRLDAESIRDRMLATTGSLDHSLYGPPLPIVEDATGQIVAASGVSRRSIYLQVRRSKPVSFLTTFDSPVMELNCDRRTSSNNSPQSLMLMNGDFALTQAEAFAEQLQMKIPLLRQLPTVNFTSPMTTYAIQLSHAWQMAYQRSITSDECVMGLRFIEQQIDYLRRSNNKDPERTAFVNLCQQLLSSNEFLYVD